MPNIKTYTSKWFWDILDSSNKKCDNLYTVLKKLTRDELIRFEFEYELAVINLAPIEDIAVNVNGEEIDIQQDTMERFCNWVVSNGHNFYKLIIEGKDVSEYFVHYFSSPPNYTQDKSLLWDCKNPQSKALTVSMEKHPDEEGLLDSVALMIEGGEMKVLKPLMEKEEFFEYEKNN